MWTGEACFRFEFESQNTWFARQLSELAERKYLRISLSSERKYVMNMMFLMNGLIVRIETTELSREFCPTHKVAWQYALVDSGFECQPDRVAVWQSCAKV